MPERIPAPQIRLLYTLALAVVYVATALIGIRLAGEVPTPVWFPAGIATGCLLVFGYWLWPAVFIGALVTNAFTLGLGLFQIPLGIGNTAEVLAATYLIRRYANGPAALESPSTVISFAFWGAGISSIIGATIGTLSFLLASAIKQSAFESNFVNWWLGDAAGIIVATPVILQIAHPARLASEPPRVRDFAVLVLVTTLTGFLIFGGIAPVSSAHYPITFLVLPVLTWAAYRFGPPGAALANLLIAVIATWGTQRNLGPFETGNEVSDFWLLEVFLAVTSLTSLVVSAGFYDRQRALVAERRAEVLLRLTEERQRASEQRRANVAEEARTRLREFMGMVVHDLRGPLTVTLGYIQLLSRRGGRIDEPQNQETLGRIENSVLMMNRLVSDLLDASRVGSGRFTVRPWRRIW
jgi:integral membrane sensor domain MASE1